MFRFTHLDGDGGNAPVLEGDEPPATVVSTYSLPYLNESVSPVQKHYDPSRGGIRAAPILFQTAGVNLTMAYADEDANMHPVVRSITHIVKPEQRNAQGDLTT
ncbi:MAG: hypothetical protein IPO10_18540 [Flavobacteriales bacterium]|nr:hypothetical protein [Flavobacteriales bacterium]